jgi:hypothetical protein
MIEEWKKIADFENYYVSNLGNVKNIKDRRLKKSGLDYILLKQQNNNNGYIQITLSKDSKDFVYSVHRLVAQAFIPNPDNLSQVHHIDKIRNNNNVLNLQGCKTAQIYNKKLI